MGETDQRALAELRAELKAEIRAEFEHRLAEQREDFERRLLEHAGAATQPSTRSESQPEDAPERGTPGLNAARSRRWLFSAGAGAAAAGMVASISEGLPAAAATGSFSSSAAGTVLTSTSTYVGGDGKPDIAVYGLSGAQSGLSITEAAVVGESEQLAGVFGASKDYIGVFGVSGGDRAGVYGQSATGVGVRGFSASGFAIVGNSDAGVSLFASGQGRLQQAVGLASPPSVSGATMGEQVRTNDGQMWICTSDSPTVVWQKLAAAAPGARGGSMNMLASPFRLWDSRSGFSSALPGPKGQLNGSVQLQVTGNGGVPAKSIGIAGTITVTNTQGAAYAQVYPSSVPPTSNVNWSGPNQTVAASFMAALDSSGRIKVNTATSTDVIIDIAGYVY
jgi:hypothetical protein